MRKATKFLFSVSLVLFYVCADAAVNSDQVADNYPAHEQRVRNLLDLSGLDKQIDAFPGTIKQGIAMAMQASGSALPVDLAQSLNAAVDRAVVPYNIKTAIGTSLFNNLNARNLNVLFKWYESDIGKRIAAAEVAASSEAAVQEMMSSIQELMGDADSVSTAMEIDDIVGATDSGMRIQLNIQVATIIGVQKAANPNQSIDPEVLKEQINAQLEAGRADMRNMVVASFVYTYKDFSDSDMQEYIEFLKTDSAKNFYRIVMSGIEMEIGKAGEVFAEMLAPKP